MIRAPVWELESQGSAQSQRFRLNCGPALPGRSGHQPGDYPDETVETDPTRHGTKTSDIFHDRGLHRYTAAT